jgi:hypothetical protein
MDNDKEIRFEKVFQWCLPRYGENDEQTLFEFQADRMRNYMRKRVVQDDWTPKYYNTVDLTESLQLIMLQGFMVLVWPKC